MIPQWLQYKLEYSDVNVPQMEQNTLKPYSDVFYLNIDLRLRVKVSIET